MLKDRREREREKRERMLRSKILSGFRNEHHCLKAPYMEQADAIALRTQHVRVIAFYMRIKRVASTEATKLALGVLASNAAFVPYRRCADFSPPPLSLCFSFFFFY